MKQHTQQEHKSLQTMFRKDMIFPISIFLFHRHGEEALRANFPSDRGISASEGRNP